MSKYLTFSQKQKYDINQKILNELADLISRNIILSIVRKPKSALDISLEKRIPTSSVYQKLARLEELALVYVERVYTDEDGKKTKFYRSRIKEAKIHISSKEPEIILEPNKVGNRYNRA